MYALTEAVECLSSSPIDERTAEIAEILLLRERFLRSREALYSSPEARHLIEREIPRLVELVSRRGK
jgi:hypothetical protein